MASGFVVDFRVVERLVSVVNVPERYGRASLGIVDQLFDNLALRIVDYDNFEIPISRFCEKSIQIRSEDVGFPAGSDDDADTSFGRNRVAHAPSANNTSGFDRDRRIDLQAVTSQGFARRIESVVLVLDGGCC